MSGCIFCFLFCIWWRDMIQSEESYLQGWRNNMQETQSTLTFFWRANNVNQRLLRSPLHSIGESSVWMHTILLCNNTFVMFNVLRPTLCHFIKTLCVFSLLDNQQTQIENGNTVCACTLFYRIICCLAFTELLQLLVWNWFLKYLNVWHKIIFYKWCRQCSLYLK